jgi:YwqJ-like deaminase
LEWREEFLGTQAVNGVKSWGAQAWSGARDWGSRAWSGAKNLGDRAIIGAKNLGIRAANERDNLIYQAKVLEAKLSPAMATPDGIPLRPMPEPPTPRPLIPVLEKQKPLMMESHNSDGPQGAGTQGKGTTQQSESGYNRTYPAATDKPKGMPLDMKQVREQYGEHGVKTVERTHQRADEIASAYRTSKGDKGTSKPGPVLSGVTDPMTGKTYFGQNFKKGEAKSPTFLKDLKEDLPEVLKQRLETHMRKVGAGEVKAENGKSLEMGSVPGSHAEIRALSQAIKAREALIGRPVTEAELPEFLMHNRNLLDKPVPAPEGVPPRCVHCWHLTDGVTVIGND